MLFSKAERGPPARRCDSGSADRSVRAVARRLLPWPEPSACRCCGPRWPRPRPGALTSPPCCPWCSARQPSTGRCLTLTPPTCPRSHTPSCPPAWPGTTAWSWSPLPALGFLPRAVHLRRPVCLRRPVRLRQAIALATEVVHFRYREEDDDQPTRLGIIAEQAPGYIVDAPAHGVLLPEYSAMLLGALQALAKREQTLEARVDALPSG